MIRFPVVVYIPQFCFSWILSFSSHHVLVSFSPFHALYVFFSGPFAHCMQHSAPCSFSVSIITPVCYAIEVCHPIAASTYWPPNHCVCNNRLARAPAPICTLQRCIYTTFLEGMAALLQSTHRRNWMDVKQHVGTGWANAIGRDCHCCPARFWNSKIHFKMLVNHGANERNGQW